MTFVRGHRWVSAAAALAAVVVLAGAGRMQEGARAARLPFASGERAEYQVKLGALSVGSGYVEIAGMETIGGAQTFHARMRVSGGVPLARVDDRYESWIDAQGLFSRRFIQDVHEVRYRRNRTYDFDPARRTFRRPDNGETGTIPTDKPLDELSFMYYARTLPLEVGDTYTLTRYFKESGNPVVLRVVRKETVTVPAGRFRTVVVQPTIRTSGIFGEGGRAEIYFTDDERRIPVLIKSRVPVVGSLTMSMRTYRAGS
ncbi:DUF3108 domain-containing protein [Longimicrobium sp.]|uniref:DUF3108 domain-containing protein n=1 Tax=Longimicrobium sp. TaxID=2029185 RepID=UPI002CDA6BE6|nr:DUF3108 domain-containing protein [Longimicrobium sp.]HSU16394.1 DUF3108 domain-containing protein [Longimicrobium sp.]